MKKSLFCAAFVLHIVFGQSAFALANNLPAGSYLNDCNNCSIDERDVLVCDCKAIWTREKIKAGIQLPCKNDIQVGHKSLECVKLPNPLPKGPYKEDCVKCVLSDDQILTCNCEWHYGGLKHVKWSSLKITTCKDDEQIANVRTELVCLPTVEGPFQESCHECTSPDFKHDFKMMCRCEDNLIEKPELRAHILTSLILPCDKSEKIVNDDGILACAQLVPVPGAPYRASCRDCFVKNTTNNVKCRCDEVEVESIRWDWVYPFATSLTGLLALIALCRD